MQLLLSLMAVLLLLDLSASQYTLKHFISNEKAVHRAMKKAVSIINQQEGVTAADISEEDVSCPIGDDYLNEGCKAVERAQALAKDVDSSVIKDGATDHHQESNKEDRGLLESEFISEFHDGSSGGSDARSSKRKRKRGRFVAKTIPVADAEFEGSPNIPGGTEEKTTL